MGEVATARTAIEEVLTSFDADTDPNETTTRIALIDRVLTVLGWDVAALGLESGSGLGDFLDYALPWKGKDWLVIEAKRAGKGFAVPPPHHRSGRSIGSLIDRGNAALRDTAKQAARYCNDRAIPYACITNGQQWVFFRGLSTESRPWRRNKAVVFQGPSEVLARFDQFSECLARSPGARSSLTRMLEVPPTGELQEPVIPISRLSLRAGSSVSGETTDIRIAAEYLLTHIVEDRDEMLTRCYVPPTESAAFGSRIARLLRDSGAALDEDGQTVLSGDEKKFADEIDRRERTVGLRHPVLVVGHVGAGKTTFLHKAHRHLRDENIEAFSAVVDLSGRDRPGLDLSHEVADVASLVMRKLTATAARVLRSREDVSEAAAREADPESPDTVATMCRKELERERRLGEGLWEADPAAWQRKRYEVLSAFHSRPLDALIHYIRHLRARFRRPDDSKHPVLVELDELDRCSDDYQRAIYALAERITRETPAVVVLAMREQTYKRGRDGGFLSGRDTAFVFHVPAPALDRVLRRRVSFARDAIGSPKTVLPKAMRGQMEALEQVCGELERAFLGSDSAGIELVAALAGRNSREALDLARNVVGGALATGRKGDGSGEHVLDSLLVSLGQDVVRKRLGLGNLFDAEPARSPAHALRSRLLAYLAWAADSTTGRAHNETVETVASRFGAWGYPTIQIHEGLTALCEGSLVAGGGTEELEDGLPQRVSITAAGVVHLDRLLRLESYRSAMACLTRWYDRNYSDPFIERADAAGGVEGLSIGDISASSAPEMFEAYLYKAISEENRSLSRSMRAETWVREVLARSKAVCLALAAESAVVGDEAGRDSIALGDRSRQRVPQLYLFQGQEAVPAAPTLAPLREDIVFANTVWIARILWALQWAKITEAGALTASEIAVALDQHGHARVAATNVAKAFRTLKGKPETRGLWRAEGRKYTTTDPGSALLVALIQGQEQGAEKSNSGDVWE